MVFCSFQIKPNPSQGKIYVSMKMVNTKFKVNTLMDLRMVCGLVGAKMVIKKIELIYILGSLGKLKQSPGHYKKVVTNKLYKW